MINLEFAVRQDEDGTIWTVNHQGEDEYRHTFRDLRDVAETFWAAGRAGIPPTPPVTSPPRKSFWPEEYYT